MIDESRLLREQSRAAGAQSLLENDLLKEAFAELENTYALAWRSTLIDDVAAREKLFLAINIVGKVREHLTSILNDGKLAAAQLRALAETAERPKRWADVR